MFCLFLCFSFVCLFYFLRRTEPSFVLLSQEEKRKFCLNQPLGFPKPELQSSCPSCFVFAHFFSQCEHPFIDNRPFPSSKEFHFQNEAKCETFVVEMSFICIIIKTHFHNKDFALSLVLKVKLFGTRK